MRGDNCKKIEIIDGVNGVMSMSDCSENYYIYGSPVLTGNWSVTMSGTPIYGTTAKIYYNASPTIGVNHIIILGQQMPDHLAKKDCIIHAFYDGSAWLLVFNDDRQDTGTIDTADIVNKAITNDKLDDVLRGFIKIGDATNRPVDLDARAAGAIIVGDGLDVSSKVVSGDVTISGLGVATIPAGTITNAKLAPLSRGYIKIGDAGNSAVDIDIRLAGGILIGNGADAIVRTISGDATVSPLGLLTLTIPAMWEPGSVGIESCTRINANTGCDATGNYATACGRNTLASGANSFATGFNSVASGGNSMALGSNVLSSAFATFAAGTRTSATADYASVFGNGCLSSGISSFSSGFNTTASGAQSLATGDTTIASGVASEAGNSRNQAKADYSSARGRYGVAIYPASQVLSGGKFSIDGDCQTIWHELKASTSGAVSTPMVDAQLNAGIDIPTDCTAKIRLDAVAVQVGGVAGTVGDSFSQTIELTAKNIGGATSIVASNRANTVGVWSIAGGVTYYEPDYDMGGITGTITISVVGTAISVDVTGALNKDIQWSCVAQIKWIGYNAFSI